MSSYSGCCHCDESCDHTAETGTNCQASYYDEDSIDGSCYDMTTHVVTCDARARAAFESLTPLQPDFNPTSTGVDVRARSVASDHRPSSRASEARPRRRRRDLERFGP